MVVLTYGPTQDHQSYMPPILTVDTEDLPALEAFGEEVWTEQLRGESKTPFTLAFTVGKSTVVGGPLFKDELVGAAGGSVCPAKQRTSGRGDCRSEVPTNDNLWRSFDDFDILCAQRQFERCCIIVR